MIKIRTRRFYRSSVLKIVGIFAFLFTIFLTVDVTKRNVNEGISFYNSEEKNEEELSLFDSEIETSDDVVVIPLHEIMKSPFTFEQDDQRVLKMIVDDFSNEPSKEPYSFDDSSLNVSNWQQSEILKLLDNKINGVFVECGAFDGEYLSNTLDLEMNHGWTGLLVEPDPLSYQRLLKKNRKSSTVEACLSANNHIGQVVLKQDHALSKVTKLSMKMPIDGFATVQCFPLFSILVALNFTKIDYFSLDIEGQELRVLKTLPWDRINITTFSIEFVHLNEGKRALKKFMRDKGYRVHLDGSQLRGTNQNVDLIFYHEELLKKTLNKPVL